MNLRLLFLLFSACVLLTSHAFGQLNVSLRLPRTSFFLNEPTIATLSISNLAGRDLIFEDSPDFGPWCKLEVKALRGEFVSPLKDEVSFPPCSSHLVKPSLGPSTSPSFSTSSNQGSIK